MGHGEKRRDSQLWPGARRERGPSRIPTLRVLAASLRSGHLPDLPDEPGPVAAPAGHRLLGRFLTQVELLLHGDNAQLGIRGECRLAQLVQQCLVAAAEPKPPDFHGFRAVAGLRARIPLAPSWTAFKCSSPGPHEQPEPASIYHHNFRALQRYRGCATELHRHSSRPTFRRSSRRFRSSSTPSTKGSRSSDGCLA